MLVMGSALLRGTEVISNWTFAPPIFSWCVTFYCLVFIYLTNLPFFRKALISSHGLCSGRDVELSPGRKVGTDAFIPDLGLNQATPKQKHQVTTDGRGDAGETD